ncbi:hypothetical protein L596_012198 [Steinernema carpocapsae]|uniref:G-protein coupled receptors family 1 profile domain-containing protein n=1 Tax=Steinernema carpocapsae TaxID=34508 RepID=A0A4U5NX65_STECR|nr:hypothetical protein L596_012198 [Steinernema carpocapsae]
MFCAIPLSFAFRYLVLIEREQPAFISSKDLKYLTLVPYALGILSTVSYALGSESSIFLREQVRSHYPSYNLSSHVLFGTNLLHFPHQFIALFLPTIPVFPTFFLTLRFKSKTIAYLDSHKQTMSPLTLFAHHRIIKALSIQSMLPFFFLVIPVNVFFVIWFFKLGIPLVEHSLFFCASIIGFLNPIATFYFINPYQQALRTTFKAAVSRRLSLIAPAWVSSAQWSHLQQNAINFP